jgi:hypothetical protein
MKQRLLALAAALVGAGAGTVLFVNWESGTVEQGFVNIGDWEVMDRDSVSMRACNTAQCNTAQDHLADAGSACIPRFAAADFRVNQRVRNCLADAGTVLSPKKYQRLELIALRCPADGGGFAFGVPFDDAGCPLFLSSAATPRCVRAPLDGGLGCVRRMEDGGTRYFGAGNVMPADAGVGVGCEPVGCGIMYGDDPAEDL